MFNYDLLENYVDSYQKSFAEAKPYPHLIIDDFLNLELATKAFQVFPKMSEMDTLKDFRQYKAQDPDLNKFNPIFQEIVFEYLHSQRFLTSLAKITGMSDLMPDDRLYAAGLAQGGNGSFLNVHIDNSSHPVQKWYRRLNLLIYLNKDWAEENGGHLQLWNPDMSESVNILPIFNRMVIFATDRHSWHGYGQVNTKDGNTRKSINIYYFTERSPDGTDYHHVTSFQARQQEILNKVLYPVDNLVRTVARNFRPKKDAHAVLFTEDLQDDVTSQEQKSNHPPS
jgi:Rps23 Pro-64 3,4-dihydroxylase Tpa1-like proline 4-hydroxylase